MLRRLDRYLIREILPPFAIGLSIYTFALLINNILLLSQTFVSKDASGSTIARYLLYLLPDLLSFTIPMATLMGLMAGLSRMSSDSEMMAYQTLGIGNSRLLKPVLLFAGICWLASFLLISWVAPETNYRLSQLNRKIFYSQAISSIKPRSFYTQFTGHVIFFMDRDPTSGEWHNVFLYSSSNLDEDTITLAERGRITRQVDPESQLTETIILLENARIFHFSAQKPEEGFSSASYRYRKVTISEPTPFRHERRYNQLLLKPLLRHHRQHPEDISLAMEWHRKFSLPFACIALAFLAIPLGVSTRRGGQISGYLASLAIIFFYYIIMMNAKSFILKKILPPGLGMWLANIFLMAAGLLLFWRQERLRTMDLTALLPWRWLRQRRQARASDQGTRFGTPLVVLNLSLPSFPRLLRRMDRHVTARLLATFLFILFSIYMIFFIITVVEQLDNAIANKQPVSLVFRYILHTTPSILSLLLPVTLLTAVLLAYSWMSKNNEILAIQVSGVSVYRITLPALLLGLALSALAFHIQENLAPESNKKAEQVLNILHNRERSTEVELVRDWVADDSGSIFFYNHLDKSRNRLVRFNRLDLDDHLQITRRITAQYAHWLDKRTLRAENGFIRTFEGDTPVSLERFPHMDMVLPQGPDLFTRKISFSEYMNIKELRSFIAYLEKNHGDTRQYRANLYQKMAFPLTSFVMVLLALPFSFSMGRKGAMHGIGIAVGASMIYWTTTGLANAFGAAGILPAALSAFIPIILFLLVSLMLCLNIRT